MPAWIPCISNPWRLRVPSSITTVPTSKEARTLPYYPCTHLGKQTGGTQTPRRGISAPSTDVPAGRMHTERNEGSVVPLDWISPDGRLILSARAVRTFAYGFQSVLLGVYLDANGFAPWQIGAVLTATLLGSAVLTAIFSTTADRYG